MKSINILTLTLTAPVQKQTALTEAAMQRPCRCVVQCDPRSETSHLQKQDPLFDATDLCYFCHGLLSYYSLEPNIVFQRYFQIS